MKITKSQLKQIIKEELENINEIGVPLSQTKTGRSVPDKHTAALNSLEDYIADNYGQDDVLRELVQAAQQAVIDYENDQHGEDDPYY